MPHPFAEDLFALAIAFFLGGLLICVPGYAFGWWLKLLNFRLLPIGFRCSLSLLIGISIEPILLYLGFKVAGPIGMWAVLALLFILGITALTRSDVTSGRIRLSAGLVAALVWVLWGSLLMLDLANGDRLYPSAVIIDQSFRSEVISSLSHSNHLPPDSYFYSPGHPIGLRYHYVLFLVPGLIQRLSNYFVPPNISLVTLSLWAGLALFAVAAAFFKYFYQLKDERRAVLIAWMLLAVGGLDLLPVAADVFYRWIRHDYSLVPVPDIEWWNGWGQVFSWVDTAIWQPHHLCALIAGLTGCLLLWDSRQERGVKCWIPAIVAGLAFATASASSVFVAVVFAAFLLLVALELILNSARNSLPLIGSALFALLLLIPFLRELWVSGSSSTSSPSIPFGIAIRPFQPLSVSLLNLRISSTWAWNVASLLALPLNYLFELGIFLVGGIWWSSRRPCSSGSRVGDHLFIGLGSVSLLVSTFLWGGTESSNDLGYRAILPLQFILLICTTHLLLQWSLEDGRIVKSGLVRFFVVSCLVIGFLTNLCGGILLRSIAVSDAGVAYRINTLRGGNQAVRLAGMRSGYEWIRQNTSPTAVVQENPEFGFGLMLGQYADRRTATYTQDIIPIFIHSANLDRDREISKEVSKQIRSLFLAGTSKERVMAVCRSTGINYLVVQDCDPVWADHNSFVWNTAPVFLNPTVRVFRCSQ